MSLWLGFQLQINLQINHLLCCFSGPAQYGTNRQIMVFYSTNALGLFHCPQLDLTQLVHHKGLYTRGGRYGQKVIFFFDFGKNNNLSISLKIGFWLYRNEKLQFSRVCVLIWESISEHMMIIRDGAERVWMNKNSEILRSWWQIQFLCWNTFGSKGSCAFQSVQFMHV